MSRANGLGSGLWASLERVVGSVESAWRRGERPALDDYLPADDSLRRAVLVELIHADTECRLKRGERVRVEDYLGRYPELAADRDAARDLIAAEFALRQRHQGGA